MSLFGQLLFIGISGHALTNEEKKLIVSQDIGGVILFGRNVSDPKQIRDLCAEIQSLRHLQKDKIPLFIGIDMEGGRVHRLKSPFTIWPPLRRLGELDQPTLSFHFAHRMGLEMRAVGINLDFAPCVDVLTNPDNKVIGDRSLGSDPSLVERHASALARGYIKSGIIPCVKHFPGHGNTFADSHHELPIENVDLKRLEAIELQSFKRSFKSRVEMVLSAHIRFPQIDPDWPATLSKIFLKDLLRDQLRFRGLVVTDDLGMKALTSHYSTQEIAVRAVEAGCELLLYCNEPEAPPLALEALTDALGQGRLQRAEVEATRQKILQFKKAKILQPDPLSMDEIQSLVGHPEHLRIAEAISQGRVPEGLVNE